MSELNQLTTALSRCDLQCCRVRAHCLAGTVSDSRLAPGIMSSTKGNKGGASTAFAVGGYMACSASMLLVNKLAVTHVPKPSFVLLMQLLASAVFTWAMGKGGFVECADDDSMYTGVQFKEICASSFVHGCCAWH